MKLFSKIIKNDGSPTSTVYKCTIRLLDDNETLSYEFKDKTLGQAVLDYVGQRLDLLERDYFGLRYMESNKQRNWVDPAKPLARQLRNVSPFVLCFRVRFYPPQPDKLQEEITKYLLFSQLRRDLLHGRLSTQSNVHQPSINPVEDSKFNGLVTVDSSLLAAYILQAEIGDYDADEMPSGYVSQYKLLLKQTPKLEEKIADYHKILQGQVPSVAEENFLRLASKLETYGIDPFPVKDQKGNHMYLGINYSGIMTFQSGTKLHHFKWSDIKKLEFDGKTFVIHLILDKKSHVVGFKCPTQASCKHAWKCSIEQRDFFQLHSSREVKSHRSGGGFFTRGSKYRYSGRVEKEVTSPVSEKSTLTRKAPTVIRKLSFTKNITNNFVRRPGGSYFSQQAKPITFENSVTDSQPHQPQIQQNGLSHDYSDSQDVVTPSKRKRSLETFKHYNHNVNADTLNQGLLYNGNHSKASFTVVENQITPEKITNYSFSSPTKTSSNKNSLTPPRRPPPPTRDNSILNNTPGSYGENNDSVNNTTSPKIYQTYLESQNSTCNTTKSTNDSPNRTGLTNQINGYYPPIPSNTLEKKGINNVDSISPLKVNGIRRPDRPISPPNYVTQNLSKQVSQNKNNYEIKTTQNGTAVHTTNLPPNSDNQIRSNTEQRTHNTIPSVETVPFDDDELLKQANAEILRLQSQKRDHLPGPNTKLNLAYIPCVSSTPEQHNNKNSWKLTENGTKLDQRSANSLTKGSFLTVPWGNENPIFSSFNKSINHYMSKMFGTHNTVTKPNVTDTYDPNNKSDLANHTDNIGPTQNIIYTKDVNSKSGIICNNPNNPNNISVMGKIITVIAIGMVALACVIYILEPKTPSTLLKSDIFAKYPGLRTVQRDHYFPFRKQVIEVWHRVCDMRTQKHSKH